MTAYSFKAQFVAPIIIGLGLDPRIRFSRFCSPRIAYAPKRQTIRANRKNGHAKLGGGVQLFWGLRTKDCIKLGTPMAMTRSTPSTAQS